MFIAISGTFHVSGYAADGDGLRFKARNVAIWGKLAGYPVQLNGQGQARLRLEGIDTLEMNLEGGQQPLKYAREALDLLLSRLGIRGNLFGPSHAREGAGGYILARRVEKHGAPVAFVFAGGPVWPDGAEGLLDTALLKKSGNYQLIAAGLAYPTYYAGLLPELREELTRACREARNKQQGFWPLDRTNSGVAMDGPEALAKNIIFPKLWRRLARFLKENGDLGGFKEYLELHPDPVTYLPTGRCGNLAEFVQVQDMSVKLTAAPEDLVFAEN